jgi:hypothetical protein
MDKPIHQLIYISAANRDFSEEELEELLTKARENNASLDITGMLLFHEGSFIQALEGPKAKVKALYEKIAQDERHTETVVLYKGDQEERDFDSWSMGFYRSNQSSAENLEGFHNFLATGFRNSHRETASRARKALLQFRQGKWHQNVQVA